MKSMLKLMVIIFFFFLLACTTGNTSNLTVHDTTVNTFLEPCPKTPNCVSSMEPEVDKHYIPPLLYTGEKKLAYQKLEAIIEADSRGRIISKQENYLKAEFTSMIFGFVDDVEFLFSPALSTIEVRSASRVGYYDFGVNRRRIEDIRKRWAKNQSQ